MKKIIYTVVVSLLMVTSCKAQQIVNVDDFNQGNNEGKYFKDLNNVFVPFLGTWKYHDGNQIFTVTLWKVEKEEYENGSSPSFYWDKIRGHYQMIEVDTNGLETLIYTSERKIGLSDTDWYPAIRGGTTDGVSSEGLIYDNSVPYNSNYILGIRGNLDLDIIPNVIPLQMQWKITLPQGMYGTDQPTEFNIPTDIILTKQ